MIKIGFEYITKHADGNSYCYANGTLPCVPRVGENVWYDGNYYTVTGVYYAPALSEDDHWDIEIKCERHA